MRNNKFRLITFACVIILIGVGWTLFQNQVLFQNQNNLQKQPKTKVVDSLQIVSTNPNPLDEATILPTQAIEITFNKPIFRSEFKHKFDPEVDHDVEVVNEENQEYGKLFRIVFKKPLEFGSGYTLFIEQNTHSEDKQTLEKNYQYHFKTIKYSGI